MKVQGELIDEFVKGATRGTASRMFIEDDTLYSYGRHFPLLVRMDWGLLLNADKYSNTTARHQSSCSRHATIQIPFSALQSAGIPYKTIELIDHEAQRWDWSGKWIRALEVITNEEYEALPHSDKDNYWKQEERRPESAVIRYDGKHYLSSMDGNNFFICQLPEPVNTVEEAFASLMPKEVKELEHFMAVVDQNKVVYQRQGEWFFVEQVFPKDTIKGMYAKMERGFTLPNRNDGNQHIATRGYQLSCGIYVSGQIRHKSRWGGRGDHQMLRLSTLDNIKIFQAYRNRAIASWSASGSVD